MTARVCLAAAAAWLGLALSAATAAELTGFYAGGHGAPGNFTYTQLDLTPAEGGAITGELAQPYHRVGKVKLPALRPEGDRLRFSADGVAYDLRRTELGYGGTATPAGGRARPASFMLRPGSPKPEVLAGYEGTYRLGGGRTLSLSRNNATSGFWWLELPSGRTGFLMNIDQTRFVAGRCFYCVEPLAFRLEMVRDGAGRATAVRFDEAGRPVVAPRLTDVREETVAFASADATKLEGTLYLPAGKGPHPALVMTHGSGAQSRNGFYGQMRFLAEAYARAGVAVLAYDKRGVGGSAGDWEKAGLDLLAQDAAAGVKALRERPDIDGKRIGLTGASQAGWIVPMATRHAPDVALMQIRSGSSPMGVEESEWRRLVLQMRGEGFSQADIDAALRIRRMMDAYTKTGQGWDELQAAFKPIEKTIWAERFIGGLPARDKPDWPWLREAFGVDATADFARFKGPIQVLYGEADFVPVAEGRAMLEAALETRVRDPDVSIAVWPGANHNYYAARTAGDREFPGLSRHVPGFYDCVTGWAAEKLGLRPEVPSAKACPK
jgi:dienelactone hydrolase